MNTGMTYLDFDPKLAPQYELAVEVGHPASPDGQTQLSLDGDGDIEARQLRRYREYVRPRDVAESAPEASVEQVAQIDVRPAGPDQPDAVRGHIEPERAAGLLAQAVGFPWERRFPSRPGIPDEAVVVLRFGAKGGPVNQVKLWLREAEDDPNVGPVLEELRGVLSELSQDRLYL